MKKIVYTTDYSVNSVAALKYAVNMAKVLNTDVIVLHVFHPSEVGDKVERWKNHQEKLLDFCREHLQNEFSDSEISVAAVPGESIPHAILDFVRDINVELIVMGAGATSTIKDLLLGSTTKDMTQISPIPILAVPSDHNPGALEQVLFASTFEEEDIPNLLELTRIVSPVNPKINIVHITHKDDGAAENALKNFRLKVEKMVPYKNLSFQTVHSSHIYEALQKTIADSKPDIVAISEYPEKSALNKVIKHEKVKKMQSYTRVPVLMIPAAL